MTISVPGFTPPQSSLLRRMWEQHPAPYQVRGRDGSAAGALQRAGYIEPVGFAWLRMFGLTAAGVSLMECN